MTTATRKPKAEPEAASATPITFAELAKSKTREKLQAYRDIVQRRAGGEMLSVADMERAATLLEELGLPLFAFDRDTDAMVRYRQVHEKYQAAADAAPEHEQRAAELAVEIAAAKSHLLKLHEEQRRATGRIGKPESYLHSVRMIRLDHPHLLADLSEAAELRIAELDRRRRGAGEASR
jgi:hypothetical protein